jgi:bifunctional UDP-N-acetylglucosamine pyrophosphorylase/glucosamine-1-phosphate N-acetyltransferase
MKNLTPRTTQKGMNRTTGARTAIAIMAAGKGTRLKSKHPKVLHQVGGKPLLAHVIAAAKQVVPAADIFAIVGHEAERVRQAVEDTGIQFVLQEPQRGTGHALLCARPALADYDTVIVLSGDAPLITAETIRKLRDFHQQKQSAMTILSAELANPTGYGRIIRKGPGMKTDEVQAIIEEKSCTPAQRKIREINSGFYAFSVAPLFANIDRLKTDNAHAEYYLTDMAQVLRKAGERVVVTKTDNASEILGSNTRAELVELDQKMRRNKCLQLMKDGATIFYPETCVIDADVEIGADTVIEPFVQLLGSTHWRRLPGSLLFNNTGLTNWRWRHAPSGLRARRSAVSERRRPRTLFASATGKRNRRRRARRQFRGDQESPHGQGIQGQPPHLPRRCGNRRRR